MTINNSQDKVLSALGPLMIDVGGTEVTADERPVLQHPLVGGVILFSRNYQSPEQLQALTAEIHSLRNPPLLVAVDHEGGRVQRFRDGFTALPPMRMLGAAWDASPQHARHLAREVGYILASELRAHGIDFSFTPVVDMDYGASSVIGDRALHSSPQAITALARSLVHGLHDGGMSAVAKHFPGHGHVQADSHVAIPVDDRTYAEIRDADLVPFAALAGDRIGGFMPAHVIYPRVDARPAGFSPVWLKDILRRDLGFDGAIFSDDLSMAGAGVAGSVPARVRAALDGGCDMALVCNDAVAARSVLAEVHWTQPSLSLARLARMHGRAQPKSMVGLREEPRYAQALRAISELGRGSGELPLA